MFNRQGVLVLILGVTLGFALSVTQGVLADRQSSEIPLQKIQEFTEILERVKSDYVEDIDDDKLLENAIRGMLSGLDAHSSYLDPDQFQEMQVSTSGRFGGLGIEVQMEGGFVKVVAPIDDTPAERAGIKAGDLIIRLDDQQVKGMTLSDAVDVMRGEPGTNITLTVVREGRDAPFTVDIERAIIRVTSVRSRMLDDDFGYIRVSQFNAEASKNFGEHLKQLKGENGRELRGLVLDLRNNPGGLLTSAVEISDHLLDGGLVTYTEGRAEGSRQDFNASSGDLLKGAPVVVLINEGSASASEIVAGALQDNGRGIIMGFDSFGKGSVQTIMPMPGGDALKLTTARYFTPGGRNIEAKGIVPDVALQPLEVRKTERGIQALNDEAVEDEDDEQSLAEEDYALHEALNLLRGLTILQARADKQ